MRTKKAGTDVTVESFSSFLEWLSPDRDRAGEEYELLHYRLRTFFAQRRCGFADELADETINRVMVKSAEEHIENKLAYFYGVAKNVYREFLRKQRVHLDIEEVTITSAQREEPSFSRECLDKCLKELSPENEELVLDYFSDTKVAKIRARRQMSEALKTTQTALRMRVLRIKHTLKDCVLNCMSGERVT